MVSTIFSRESSRWSWLFPHYGEPSSSGLLILISPCETQREPW